jgi:hypothetical protein
MGASSTAVTPSSSDIKAASVAEAPGCPRPGGSCVPALVGGILSSLGSSLVSRGDSGRGSSCGLGHRPLQQCNQVPTSSSSSRRSGLLHILENSHSPETATASPTAGHQQAVVTAAAAASTAPQHLSHHAMGSVQGQHQDGVCLSGTQGPSTSESSCCGLCLQSSGQEQEQPTPKHPCSSGYSATLLECWAS